MILWMVLVVFIVLFGGGFLWGWYVRGWEVKRLKKSHEQIYDHAIRAGWVVSKAELLKNLFEVGIHTPYIPAQFTLATAEKIAGPGPYCPQCHEGTISKLTGACSKCDYKWAVLPFPNYGKEER
jgi:hypothetical protein